jgi:8-amino-7-oxononanoate synthase
VKPPFSPPTLAGPPPALAHLSAELERLRGRSLLRERPEPEERGVLSLCTNDYLGLASRNAPEERAGAGASRLVAGEQLAHRRLEDTLTRWLRVPAALTFSSGYAANVGSLSALADRDDLIVSDALNHASLIDGARLSRARVVVTPHLDTDAVGRALREPRPGRAWVVTESYFGMDADGPDLGELRAHCDRYGAALVVDEAHALGVLGPEGRGLCAEQDVKPDVLIGTLGKAFGAGGAFVAGCPELVAWLWNRARSFVFSTGLSPVVALAAEANVRMAYEHPELRAATLRAAARFRSGLRELGVEPLGHGHVIPWVLGAAAEAVRVARALSERGLRVPPIRPPSVPEGSARIRFAVTAQHTDSDVARALVAIRAALSAAGGALASAGSPPE